MVPAFARLPAAYLFLLAAALAFVACCEVISACFFWLESLARDCFCEACFCTDFGDLSPMVVCLSLHCLTIGMFVSPRALFLIRHEGRREQARPALNKSG